MLYFRQVDPDRNRARYYSLELAPTLFGEVALVRHWGRISTQGQRSATIFPSYEEATAALLSAAAKRVRRNYTLELRQSSAHGENFVPFLAFGSGLGAARQVSTLPDQIDPASTM